MKNSAVFILLMHTFIINAMEIDNGQEAILYSQAYEWLKEKLTDKNSKIEKSQAIDQYMEAVEQQAWERMHAAAIGGTEDKKKFNFSKLQEQRKTVNAILELIILMGQPIIDDKKTLFEPQELLLAMELIVDSGTIVNFFRPFYEAVLLGMLDPVKILIEHAPADVKLYDRQVRRILASGLHNAQSVGERMKFNSIRRYLNGLNSHYISESDSSDDDSVQTDSEEVSVRISGISFASK